MKLKTRAKQWIRPRITQQIKELEEARSATADSAETPNWVDQGQAAFIVEPIQPAPAALIVPMEGLTVRETFITGDIRDRQDDEKWLNVNGEKKTPNYSKITYNNEINKASNVMLDWNNRR